MTALDHDALLTAARAGDAEALAELIRQHHDRVYRYGLRVCRDGDVDDAVQEAFLTLSRSLPALREPRAVVGWLLQTVKHWCLRMLRPFQRERRSLGTLEGEPDALPASVESDPERALARWQLVNAVHAAIAQLAPMYREVLVLRDLEGLSGPEVARQLGLSEETMKTRLHRARAQLRTAMVEAGHAPPQARA